MAVPGSAVIRAEALALRRSARAARRDATVLGDDWPEEAARLRKELDGEILVYGSRRLAHGLIGMDLVDELRLLVYPVVLGAGDRLFGETQDKIALRLVESRPLGGGVVSMIYAPATAAG